MSKSAQTSSFFENMLDELWRWRYFLLIVAVSLISHGINLFGYPYFENDEGVYLSQAWSLQTQGKLSPYTYWYDHAPVGWITIMIAALPFGGVFGFGSAHVFGRLLMLCVHVANSLLVYNITKKLTKKDWIGLFAVLLFSLSPLAIYYQRRVLLDNLLVFWVLLSYALLLTKTNLRSIMFSATAMGIAVLTKESGVFFLPAFIYALWERYKGTFRTQALIFWVSITGLVISWYPLYALLKTELFDSGGKRASLLGTLGFQVGRGEFQWFWEQDSIFWTNLLTWLTKDTLFVSTMGIILILSTFSVLFVKKSRVPLLFALSYLVYLIRGKLVIDFYIVPMLPFIAILGGLIVSQLYSGLPKALKKGTFVLIFGLVSLLSLHDLRVYSINENQNYFDSLDWIRKNVPKDATIITDSTHFLDLQNEKIVRRPFSKVEWFSKIETDPQIRYFQLENDWRNVDYILLSHEMIKQIDAGNMPFLQAILARAKVVRSWQSQNGTFVDVQKNISTNGDWFILYKVKSETDVVLDDSWQFYKQNFITQSGQVLDPQSDSTTSEGQAYALLRAAVMHDKDTFDIVWQWTQNHLQFRNEDDLLSWQWKGDDSGSVTDPNSAADADLDAAMALLMAYKQWKEPKYLADAKKLITSIWNQNVIQIGDRSLLIAGSLKLVNETQAIVNPSYFSPAWYRAFAQVDSLHNWDKVADDTYYWLDDIRNNYAVLPPDWILIDTKTASLSSAKDIMQRETDVFSYDAFRTFWRVAMDYHWYTTPEAKAYLDPFSRLYIWDMDYLTNPWSEYNLDGQKRSNHTHDATRAGYMGVMSVSSYNKASQYVWNSLQQTYHEEGYWNDRANYYAQNWTWLGVAMVEGRIRY